MRRLAFVLFQSQRRGSYLHDGEVSIRSGLLREADVPNEIFEVVFNERDEAENDQLLSELAARLHDGGYELLVFQRIWDPGVVQALRSKLEELSDSLPHFVFIPRKLFGENTDPYEFLNTQGSVHVLEMLARSDKTLDPSTIAGLHYRDASGNFVQAEGEIVPDEANVDRWKLRPNFQRISINPGAASKGTHFVVYGNPGCPYRKTIYEEDFWKGLEVDPQATNTKGCSFCNINLAEDYRFVKGIARQVVEQIQHIQQQMPGKHEIILLDQDPFPFLPELFSLLLEENIPPLHLLIQARADLFLLRKEAFETSLESARAGGHGLTPFLIGFENFHQPTLDLYNKGVTVEMNIEVLNFLRSVAERYPDVYDRDRVSPGFILWHPWVSFGSLRTNIDLIKEVGFDEFRSEMALSKIRLYPDIPFYWKAKEDDLLVENYSDRGLDSASRYGYPEEAPYRFAEPEAQTAYTLLAILCRRFEPIHELKLLELILRWVEEKETQWKGETLLADSAPDKLVALFLAEHEKEVQALRKEGNIGGRARDVEGKPAQRLRRLLAPIWVNEAPAPGGFELARLLNDGKRIQLFFAPPGKSTDVHHSPSTAIFRIILESRSSKPHYMQGARLNISYATGDETSEVQQAAQEVCALIQSRDRGAA
jgi:radical SAM superfamily enzyme YgiQ (UPF0313 family)